MITIFEKYNIPIIGDFIIVNHKMVANEKFAKFIENRIGEIVKIEKVIWMKYSVKYDVDEYFSEFGFNYMNPIAWSINEILFFSSDKSDCEAYLQTQKYNL